MPMPMARLNDAPPAANPFSSSSYAHERSRDLANRCMSLADRLVGPTPQGATAVGKDPPADSLFAAMEQEAQATMNAVNMAMDALNRVESNIP